MKLYYCESKPIIISKKASKEINVPLVSNYIWVKKSNGFRIEGIVCDRKSYIPIKDVVVIVASNEYEESCVTDRYGRFRTKLSYRYKPCIIFFFKREYKTKCFRFYLVDDKNIRVYLKRK